MAATPNVLAQLATPSGFAAPWAVRAGKHQRVWNLFSIREDLERRVGMESPWLGRDGLWDPSCVLMHDGH